MNLHFTHLAMALVALTLGTTLPVSLSAQESTALGIIRVLGWASTSSPLAISVYNLDGHKTGVKNYSGFTIAGPHRWDVDFDLIEIAPGEWVQKRLLSTQLCEDVNYHQPTPPPPSVHVVRTAGAASGKACGS